MPVSIKSCSKCTRGYCPSSRKDNTSKRCSFYVGEATKNHAPSGQAELPGCKASEIEAQRILIAAAVAHRACCGTEHDPENGKLHGYCVVCGIAWPCETAKKFM